jgi:hypothetical protein
MSTYEEGKKTYFAPESPEYLKRIFELKRSEFEAKQKELESLLPGLTQMFQSAGDKPLVRFFSGKEGITAMRADTLTLKRDEEINIIYSYDSLFGIYTEQEADEYASKRVDRGIRVRHVYTRKEGKLPSENITALVTRRFIPSEKLPLDSDFFVYGSKVAIMALKGKIFGVIIESNEIASSFKSIFELLWKQGEV